MVTLIAPRKIVATATASATLARGAHTPVDATSGAKTMTLPSNAPAGVEVSVEKVDTSANAVTVSGTLRGVASSISLTSQYEARTFLSDGAGSWTPTSDHRTATALSAIIGTEAVARWKPSIPYTTGQVVLNPSGDIVSANSNFTSGTSYNPANWTVVSASRSYVQGNFAQLVAPAASLPTPFVVAHRGGGSLISPDGSIEGMQTAFDLGIEVLEADCVALSDGGLGVMHDATVDRTTTSTGNCEDYNSMSWRTLTLDPANWGMPGWPTLRPPTWGDALLQFAGRRVLMPEAKGTDSVTGATNIAAAAALAGVRSSVVIQSFIFAACQAAVAGGCDALYLDGFPAKTPAELVAAGIKYVGITSTYTNAQIAAFQAAGIIVVSYTFSLQSEYDAQIAKGVQGIFLDDPVYASRRYAKYRRKTAPWTTNPVHYHGHQNNSTRGTYVGSPGAYRYQPSNNFPTLAGWGSPIVNAASTYSITVPFTVDATGTDATKWGGMYFGVTSDALPQGDTADGFLAMLRQNGTMQLYQRPTGAGGFTSQGTLNTAALTTAQSPTIKVDVTPTSVTLTRTDTPVATLSAGLTSGVAVTSLPVNSLPLALASGAKVMLTTGQIATLSAAASAGATSLTVASITPSAAVASGSALNGAITAPDTTTRGGYFYLCNNGFATGLLASFGAVAVTP